MKEKKIVCAIQVVVGFDDHCVDSMEGGAMV